MKRAGTIILLLFLCAAARATAAYPLPVTVRQPDGTTVTIIMHGDEFCRWTTNIWGHPVRQDADGYWRVSPSLSPIQLSAIRQYSLDRMLPSRDLQHPPVTKSGTEQPGDIRVLVIPVQFSDTTFRKEDYREYLDRKLNSPGFSEEGADGSAKDYFEANFIGSTFTFDITDIVTLDREASYYGANDESVPSMILYDINMPQLVREACTKLDSKIDFRQYDRNGDGKIDHLIFVYAGYNEAEGGGSDAIWSHEWDLTNKKFKFDGVTIGLYAAAAELHGASGSIDAGIGTFCHELSHTFGLKDLYDVNYGGDGICNCLWQTLSLMDYGNFTNSGKTPPFYCAIERETAGSADIRTLLADETVELEPIHRAGTFYRHYTETEGEYFLIEVRSETGWDKHIGGHGMVIYHIDKSERNVGGIQASVRWNENLINTVSGHECADLVESLPDARSIRQVFFPGQGSVTEFGPLTIPAFESWDGNSQMLRISDIAQKEETVTFTVHTDSTERLLKAKDIHIQPFQTEAEISWKSEKDNAVWGLRWFRLGQEEETVRESIVQDTRSVLTELEANSEYQAQIFHIGRSRNGDTTSVLFSTPGFTSPYPVITSIRNIYQKGEILRLKVQNIHEKTESVTWYINGLRLESETAVLTETGAMEVKAIIRYASDGSTETIAKTINVLENE